LSSTEDLVELNFEVLSSMKIAKGDIFWKKKSGKLIPLCFIGDRIDHDYISKFQKMTNVLWMKVVGNSNLVDEGVTLLKKITEASDDEQRFKVRDEFFNYLKPHFWSEEGKGNLVDFVTIFQEVFYDLSDEQEHFLENKSLVIFKRSYLCAASTTALAMCLGYVDFDFLKDLYQVNFYMDVGIEKSQFTTSTMNVLEKERVFPGARNENLSDAEKEVVEQHAFQSISKLEGEATYNFNNKSIKRLIKFHHERLLGDGFPLGLNSDELSDLEKIIIMVFQNITYDELSFTENDGSMFLKNFIGDADQGECEARLEQQIKNVFDKESSITAVGA